VIVAGFDSLVANVDTEQRIQKALEYANEYAHYDEAHHKQWVIDQMVRALFDVPLVPRTVETQYGDFTYSIQDVNSEYEKFTGDGWDVGVPP
jgi:hypothetical protein